MLTTSQLRVCPSLSLLFDGVEVVASIGDEFNQAGQAFVFIIGCLFHGECASSFWFSDANFCRSLVRDQLKSQKTNCSNSLRTLVRWKYSSGGLLSHSHKRLKERFLIRQNVQIFEESVFFKLCTTIQQKTVKPTYLLKRPFPPASFLASNGQKISWFKCFLLYCCMKLEKEDYLENLHVLSCFV